MVENTLYRIVLPYACYGVIANKDNIIIEAPPIAKWSVGKDINYFLKWVEKKGGHIDVYV